MKYPYMQWFTHDWLSDPAVSLCSPATRGVWIDLLSAMHELDRSGELSGTRDQLARIGRCSTVEVAQALTELQTTRTAEVTERNGVVTVRNRRMYREAKSRKSGNLRVQEYREKRRCNANDTPHSTEFIFQNSKSSSSMDPPPTPQPPPPIEKGPPYPAAAAVESLIEQGMSRVFAEKALSGCSRYEAEIIVKGVLKDLRKYQNKHAFATPDDRGRWLTGAIRAGRQKYLADAKEAASNAAQKQAEWDSLEQAKAADQALVNARLKALDAWKVLTPERRQELARMASAINWPADSPDSPNIRRFITRNSDTEMPANVVLDLLRKELAS